MMRFALILLASSLLSCSSSVDTSSKDSNEPLFVTVDLEVGETREVVLADGSKTVVHVSGLDEELDPVCSAVRKAEVTVNINGEEASIVSANYNLPVEVGGIQVDCPITRGYYERAKQDSWGLVKDVRMRLWPMQSDWIRPETFVYPAEQRWFATFTQMANEPTYVDGGDVPGERKIYYHSGLDIGGADGLIDVVAATDGLVVSVGDRVLPGHEDSPVSPRYDVVYILDSRGWYYRYSHLDSIAPGIEPGMQVRKYDRIGVLGKEGASGGWAHLHFEIKSLQPSGLWGTEEGYAFLWQSYLSQYSPKLVAVARPHALTFRGGTVQLDGSKSWSSFGTNLHYEWTFDDGSSAEGPVVEKVFKTPGAYCPILKVSNDQGDVAFDFPVIQVLDKASDTLPATIHPAFSPTIGIGVDEPVTFLVRAFRTGQGEAIWDFGDGSAPVRVPCDGSLEKHSPDGYSKTIHRFSSPGGFLVKVSYFDENRYQALGRLFVKVEE